MIGLNWFEVRVPEQLSLPCELLSSPDAPRLDVSYGTVRICHGGVWKRYHLTPNPPSGIDTEDLNPACEPYVVRHAVERGFLQAMEDAGFFVRSRASSFVGLKPVDGSLFPEVYQRLEGIAFRCYYFNNDNQVRWGLVLSHASSQRFLVSLEDEVLADIARATGRVVPLQDASLIPRDEMTMGHRASVLVSVTGGKAVILNGVGRTERVVSAETLTIPCSKEHLNQYMQRRYTPMDAERTMSDLQRSSLSVTREGRINRQLAKEQMIRVRSTLIEHGLDRFHLPIPSRPRVSLSLTPLELGETP